MSTNQQETTTLATLCPSWCELTPEQHAVNIVQGIDFEVEHRRTTSTTDAPYSVKASAWGHDAPMVAVWDSGGEDLTPDQARAFAIALVQAAGIAGGLVQVC